MEAFTTKVEETTVRTWLIELLLHVHLLGKTVQFLHEIRDISSLDSQDKMKWKDLKDEFYGEDPDAPHPYLVDDDGVVVARVEMAHSLYLSLMPM